MIEVAAALLARIARGDEIAIRRGAERGNAIDRDTALTVFPQCRRFANGGGARRRSGAQHETNEQFLHFLPPVCEIDSFNCRTLSQT